MSDTNETWTAGAHHVGLTVPDPFDRRRNLGLHHLALRVREGALDALHQRLAARDDVEIELPPEPLGGGATRHMMTRIPGGLRVEIIAPARG